jgi:hypothetical protein
MQTIKPRGLTDTVKALLVRIYRQWWHNNAWDIFCTFVLFGMIVCECSPIANKRMDNHPLARGCHEPYALAGTYPLSCRVSSSRCLIVLAEHIFLSEPYALAGTYPLSCRVSSSRCLTAWIEIESLRTWCLYGPSSYLRLSGISPLWLSWLIGLPL